MRKVDDDGGGSGGGSDAIYKWVDINWTFTEPSPAGLVKGFEVVIYTGTDPTDTSKYLKSPERGLLATDRRLVTTYSYRTYTAAPTNVNAAVRVVYPDGKSAWVATTSSLAPATPPVTAYQSDNLIPNPTSELGAVVGYAGQLVVNDATNAYAGNYCRKLDASATNQTALTPVIPCIYGDQFSFDGYVKGSNGTVAAQLVLKFYDASGATVGTSTSVAFAGAVYQTMTPFRGAAGSSAVGVQAFVQASTTGAGQFLYFDNLSLRRAVKFNHMETDGGFRAANALKNLLGTGTTADRAFYVGNCDPNTLGGAPKISCLTITRRRWDTTLKIGRLELSLTPSGAPTTDNLDGMRPAKIVWYRQSIPGTTATLTLLDTTYPSMHDRLFANTTDSNAANTVTTTTTLIDGGISTGCPACLVTLYNAFGPSETHCFYAATGNGDGSALVDNGQTWPAGITGGSGGGAGGGGGGGGSCPAPWVLVDVIEAGVETRKRADALVAGDLVVTYHAGTSTRGRWPIKAVSTVEGQERWDVTFEDGLVLTDAVHHRFYLTDGRQVSIEDLQPGDIVAGDAPRVVVSAAYRDRGPVVAITVDMAYSYQTSGVLQSNLKAEG
ncbi:hypothetical protein [Geothrix campi]|uniref:hypothetical protein n=1 Tax=Geothrix campi TaxID=2966450 RepID=UPI00214763A9|nr:hypothetical protein [Geothrix sp. SG10]